MAIFQCDIVVKVLRAFLAGSSPWMVSGEGYSKLDFSRRSGGHCCCVDRLPSVQPSFIY